MANNLHFSLESWEQVKGLGGMDIVSWWEGGRGEKQGVVVYYKVQSLCK